MNRRVRMAKWAYFLSRSARRGTKHVANLALSVFSYQNLLSKTSLDYTVNSLVGALFYKN